MKLSIENRLAALEAAVANSFKGEKGDPSNVPGPEGGTGAPGETVVGPKGETGGPGRDGVTLEEVAKVIDDILAIVSVATEVRALLGTSGKDALTQLLDIKAQIAALALDPRYQRAGAFRDEWTS